MATIISTLMALIALIVRRIMNSDRRLTDREFAAGCLALVPTLIFLAHVIWTGWTEHCASFGLRPFPDIAYDLYPRWELVLSPVVVTILIYAGLVFLLSLIHWPEEMSREEADKWQLARVRSSLWVLTPLLCLDLGYLAFRWYPVWSQWF